MRVTAIVRGGIADRSGQLLVGDRIVSVNLYLSSTKNESIV